MNKAGINDGDLVLCRLQEKADTGDRVVALLGGENVTIKEYGPREDGIRLLIPKSTNKKQMHALPEPVHDANHPLVGQDSRLVIDYQVITPATSIDELDFTIPATVYS